MNKKIANAAFILLGVYVLYNIVDRYIINKNMVRYPNFGISVPAGFTVHGIDVSKHQKEINWDLVSKMRDKGMRIEFAILKATEGTNFVDRHYEENYEEARKQQLLVGAYLYFRPGQNGAIQANHFIKNAKLQKADLAPVIDIEETDGVTKKEMLQQLMQCVSVLEKEFDIAPIIYSNAKFYEQYLADSCKRLPLWVAHYYEAKPDIARDYILWQHNDNGRVDGIDAPVDFNVVNGSLSDLLGHTIR